jgi:SAM-dependent methyltransferase
MVLVENSLKYKDIACPVCQHESKIILYPDTLGAATAKFDYNFSPDHNKTYRIVRCANCRHVYSSPLPMNLWENYVSVVDQAYLKNQGSRYATAEKVIARIRKFCPSGRLLDVGCATGDFLHIAQEYYKVEGLEISQWSAEIARKRGIQVHEILLDGMKENGIYDVISLWGVIEHFENPSKEIQQLFRLLKPNGIVCLWTGDVDSIWSRILGKNWWYYQGQHIQMFTNASLCKLFKDAGFKKEWIGLYPYVTTIGSILRSLGRYPLVCKIVTPILTKIFGVDHQVQILLKGEMFAIFRKP